MHGGISTPKRRRGEDKEAEKRIFSKTDYNVILGFTLFVAAGPAVQKPSLPVGSTLFL